MSRILKTKRTPSTTSRPQARTGPPLTEADIRGFNECRCSKISGAHTQFMCSNL